MEHQALMGVSTSELEAAMQSDLKRDGVDDTTDALGIGMVTILEFLYTAIPNPPVSPAAPLASAVAPGGGGVDRISRLPDAILRNVVSRLPAKDAARTAALASTWRGLWRSVPLALVDAHVAPRRVRTDRMMPGGDDVTSALGVAVASRVLEAHPGPFRCAHLTMSHMASHQPEMGRWLKLLAAKGVQELVFINRPWPLDLPLPAEDLFACAASLTRLHLGFWRFPSTGGLPRATRFRNLQELILSFIFIQDRDLQFLIDKSPVLEILTLMTITSKTGSPIRLVSRSLRCVQVTMSAQVHITVVDAPRLERLLLWMVTPGRCSRIRIGHAPKLRMLGHWHPEIGLEIGNTSIKVPIFHSVSLYLYNCVCEQGVPICHHNFCFYTFHIAGGYEADPNCQDLGFGIGI
jgi:hypothetical protein